MEQNESNRKKKPYPSPKIVKVKLLAEEAILAGCKVNDSGSVQNSGGGNCNVAAHGACSAAGS